MKLVYRKKLVKNNLNFLFLSYIFGDGGVGKTTLVNRYISGKYSEDFKMTIGIDFYTKNIEIEGIRVNLQIWDFGGGYYF